MAVRGCTFHLQTMTSSDWAHQAINFFTGVCGITKGCIATLTADKKISISKGYFYTYGRLCEEDGTSLIPVPTVTTTTHRMLVYEIDLSKTNTKSLFSQGQYKILSAYPDYPNPVMENLDNGGTIFQMQFCTWDQSVSGITNFRYTAQPAIATREMLETNRSGWSAIYATDKLTYKSASAPTFVCNTLNIANDVKDLRSYLSIGMKVKLTQDATVKYFFITAIDATSVTLFGGSNNILTSAAISNVCYSVVQSPYGFPIASNGLGTDFTIEKGSNAYGNYKKRASGELIMWGQTNIASMPITSAVGSSFLGTYIQNLPVASLTPVTAEVGTFNNVAAWADLNSNATMMSSIGVSFYRPVSGTVPVTLHWQAIGTWK